MRTILFPLLLIGFLSASAITIYEEMTWKINQENSIVRFEAPKAKGVFSQVTGNISFDKRKLAESSFDVSVDVNSIKTGNGLKNAHAKGKQYFNVKEYPTIDFKSKSIKKKFKGFMVVGDLTMTGVTKEVKIPFTFKKNKEGATFEGDFKLDPTTFGQDKMGNEVKIALSIPVKE